MKLRLKEEPKEWLKFTAVMAIMAAVIVFLLHRRGVLPRPGVVGVAAVLVATLVLCMIRPRWFRGFYRAGMTASWHVGQFMGRVLLTLLFLGVVTPLGLLLRLAGKDLLELKPRRNVPSHWKTPRPPGDFRRQF